MATTAVAAASDSPPTVRWVETPKRHLARKVATGNQTEHETFRRPTFRWAGTDDHGVLRYEVRSREFMGTRYSSSYAAGWSRGQYPSRTSPQLRPRVYAGRTVCLQVRAVDTARQYGAWSRERCTTVPVQGSDLLGSQTMSAYRHARTSVFEGDRAETAWSKAKGGAVRLGVVAEPSAGELDVYIGKRRIGHVDARARTKRVKYVTVRPRTEFGWGRLRLVGTEGQVDVHSYVVLP
ncbi:hypothetical protein [Isoptericola jiangsuensis]|nr:hypothetical protein [Isoptericola jiangsuensis]